MIRQKLYECKSMTFVTYRTLLLKYFHMRYCHRLRQFTDIFKTIHKYKDATGKHTDGKLICVDRQDLDSLHDTLDLPQKRTVFYAIKRR